jgi:hypothetical protein
MTCRTGRWSAPLLLATVGCFTDGAGTLLVSPDAFASGAKLPTNVKRAPATEEAAKRALTMGQKVLAANPQLGTRPLIFTIGGPEPEIFHTGSGQIFLTEGLVRQCSTDGQLAAVLCHELAKVAADREELVGAALKAPDHGEPDVGHPGHDYRPGFGGADGLRLTDLAKDDQEKRRRAVAAPEPEPLARQYLRKAGYADADFDAAAPLLRAATTSEKFKPFITTSSATP